MAVKKYAFKIWAKDNSGCSSSFSFLIYPKTEDNVTHYDRKVVLAGAKKCCASYLGVPLKSYVHYFDISKRKTVKFTYKGKVYTGIVLDACGASCKISSSQPNIVDDKNII